MVVLSNRTGMNLWSVKTSINNIYLVGGYGRGGYYGDSCYGNSGYGHTAPPYKGGYKNRGKGYGVYCSGYGQSYYSAYKSSNDSAHYLIILITVLVTIVINHPKMNRIKIACRLKKRQAKVMCHINNSSNWEDTCKEIYTIWEECDLICCLYFDLQSLDM